MARGYLGDVCLGNSSLRNHIVFTNAQGRAKEITPFCGEIEAIVLCEKIILLSDKTLYDKELLSKLEREFTPLSANEILDNPLYSKYATEQIEDAVILAI